MVSASSEIRNYHLRSSEVNSLEQLQALLIADRLKQLMPPDIRSFVTQSEMKSWPQAKDLAELEANFEESTSHGDEPLRHCEKRDAAYS